MALIKFPKAWGWAVVLLILLAGGGYYAFTRITNDKVNKTDKGLVVELTPEFIKSVQQYDELTGFSEGYAIVRKDGKYGFINIKGEEVIPCKYENARSFSEGLAAVQKNNKWGFVNTNGEEVIPCRYNQVEQFTHGVALATRYSNDELNSYTQFYNAYVDKNGHDTFMDEIKQKHENSIEDIEDENLDDVFEGEELSSAEQNEDLSWIEGNWRYQMQSLGEILETRVGISGDIIVVILNGRNYYTGKFTIEGDHLVYDRHNGMSSYLIIDRVNKRLKASEDSYMERF